MSLQFGPPIKPMLAQLKDELPTGDEWVYEPKWDGFRAIAFSDGGTVHVQSRDLRPLERYFPELVPALLKALPRQSVVDGEVVVANDDGLDFDALQQRIHPAESRIKLLSQETPASFIAFDLLALGRKDLRSKALEARRAELIKAVGQPVAIPAPRHGTQIVVTPQTSDVEQAVEWLSTLEGIGLDGVVAKKIGTPYVEAKRTMVKVKQHRTVDCIVGGYRLSKSKDGVGSLLLGLYDDAGVMHFVGHTSSFKAAERREVLKLLQPLEGGHSFGEGRAPGGVSRWTSGREMDWVPLEPKLVCEVTFDKLQGDRFRHAATFLRWRDDKAPAECTFDQITSSALSTARRSAHDGPE
jgi:ATP-dependent DNA ligase